MADAPPAGDARRVMFLTGLGTALPPTRYSQSECWTAFQQAPQFPNLTPRSRSVLGKVLTGDSGIESRHLAVSDLADGFVLTPDALHDRFEKHAPVLALEAARRALDTARLGPGDIDAVLVSTCTGYLCPGLSGHVAEGLGLRADLLALDLVGQGCGAALPNWRTAEALLAAGRADHVLSVCVEVCSAAFYLDDDPGVLVSACLFGDGAGAAILSSRPRFHARRVEWKAAGSRHDPAERGGLRFEHSGGMLRNVLSRGVPALAARHVGDLLPEMLSRAALDRGAVTGWILHAGGREVLLAVRARLGLGEHDVRHSAAVLRDLGNVSSPSVLFVLEKALAENAPGGWWWMSSFGAGFSCHGALLKVD